MNFDFAQKGAIPALTPLRVLTIIFVITVTAAGLSSCKKEASCENCASVNTLIQAPIACAGEDLLVNLPIDSTMLDGSCSSDPDNNISTYVWRQISGPSLSVISTAEPLTKIKNLVEGIFLFQLTVMDASGLFSIDTVQITVVNNLPTIKEDIYAAGVMNGVATYWKNGVPVQLSKFESEATSISVNGKDVYVAGWEGDAFRYSENVAKYWKNGQPVALTGAIGAGANDILIVGVDVYVAGWKLSPNWGTGVAMYWKNGEAVVLSDGWTEAEATAIVVVGSDVYVAGHENGIAKYWKNGVAVALTNGANQAFATDIAVVDSSVYVSGSEWNGTAQVAKFWKNGHLEFTSNGSAFHATANAIAVVGSEVYVAGWEGDFAGMVGGHGAVAKCWRNGKGVALTNGSSYAYPSSLALFGNDVYVGGTEWINGSQIAKFWKNGSEVVLSDRAMVSDILVVRR